MADAIGSAVSSSIAGLQRAERQLTEAASKLATGLRTSDTSGASSTASQPSADPTAAILQVAEAKVSYSANAEVLETTNKLTRKILDITV